MILELAAREVLALLLSSMIATYFLTIVVRSFATKYGIMDFPSQAHKTHSEPVPYLGGLAIVIATVSVTLSAMLLANFSKGTIMLAFSILLPALLMATIGLIDDVKDLSPYLRFVFQNIVAIVSAGILIWTDTLGTPTENSFLDLFITVLWLVGITNAVNFFDNIDGGASGSIFCTTSILSIIAWINGQNLIAAMSLVLAGSTLGFLIWNKPPARIYMGDAGSLFLGTLVSALSIRLDSPSENLSKGFIIMFFILAAPILDISVVVFDRIRKGKSPFLGGRDHISHRLIALGLDRRAAVIILWSLSLFYALLALAVFLEITYVELFAKLIGAVLFFYLALFFLKVNLSGK